MISIIRQEQGPEACRLGVVGLWLVGYVQALG